MKRTWTLYVCPECDDAVSEDASRWGVSPEFMAFCRHPVGPRSADLGRNVKRERVRVVRKPTAR
jgi:hypothetical protein